MKIHANAQPAAEALEGIAPFAIEREDQMTPEYRENLLNLLTMQADSELAGAYGYVPWITKAPTVEEKLAVATIVKDEVRHAKAIYTLLERLGFDVSAHISRHDLTARVEDSNADLGAARAGQDKRVNIFYYPIDTWADFVMFNFCMDRGAGHQLEDARQSSYKPWALEIEQIFREEMTHVGHGDFWVKKMGQDPATRDEIQAALDRWFPRTLAIFGRPNTSRNKLYRALGLKRRDNDEVRRTFIAELVPLIEAAGLKTPPIPSAG